MNLWNKTSFKFENAMLAHWGLSWNTAVLNPHSVSGGRSTNCAPCTSRTNVFNNYKTKEKAHSPEGHGVKKVYPPTLHLQRPRMLNPLSPASCTVLALAASPAIFPLEFTWRGLTPSRPQECLLQRLPFAPGALVEGSPGHDGPHRDLVLASYLQPSPHHG